MLNPFRFWLPVALSMAFAAAGAQRVNESWSLKPYRVLMVVDQWGDPASQVIQSERDPFQPVAALLKAWSVPFDILRLDQQTFGAGYLFDRSGRVRYGAVLWLADASSYERKNVEELAGAVKGGTSVMVVGSRFLDSTLEQTLGLKFKSNYTATDPLEIGAPHFITREIARQKTTSGEFGSRFWVEPQGAQVLISQADHPVLTVHEVAPNTAAVWLAAPNFVSLRDSAYWRSLFFRSLVWSIGYLVMPDVDYSHRILMLIDDWGTADKSFLSYWRYQTVTEELMRKRVIPPLASRKFVVGANVLTGFVDRKTHRVISPWAQNFTDSYGVQQDYASTQRALKAAVAAGVLEIESHGWTHMQTDLDSPPGPWWTADLKGEGSVGRWYEEFEDTRRGADAPALAQLFHMKRSLAELREDFDSRPQSIIIGGSGWSKSYQHHSARTAAQAGFGLFIIHPRYFYLDRDLALDMAGIAPGGTIQYDRELQLERWPAHPDGPLVQLFHDRDISLDHDFVERTLAAIPNDMSTVTVNQYVAILHTQVESSGAQGWQFRFHLDDPYCAYFKDHPSSWRLVLADPLIEKIRSAKAVTVAVDNGPASRVDPASVGKQSVVIEIPAGLGIHTWKLEPSHGAMAAQ
jgi:hypothetical protein